MTSGTTEDETAASVKKDKSKKNKGKKTETQAEQKEDKAEQEEIAEPEEDDAISSSTTIIIGKGEVRLTMELDNSSKISARLVDAEAVIMAILTDEQLAKVEQGAAVDIIVEAKMIDESAVPKADKAVIEEGLETYRKDIPNLSMANYIDLSISFKFDDGDWEQIEATNTPILITITIPDKYKGVSGKYYIMRAHGGKCTLLKDSDNDEDTVTIATGRFSTYALMYDNEIPDKIKNDKTARILAVLLIIVAAALIGESIYLIISRSQRGHHG